MTVSRSVCLALLLSSASASWAQEERAVDHFAGAGVRAMGMGGAFAGIADDLSAMLWNPAGLAQIGKTHVHAGLQRGSRTNRATFAGTRASSSVASTRLASAGAVVPYPVYRGSLVFAAGLLRLQDFDWSLRQQGFDPVDSLLADFRFEHRGGTSLVGLAVATDVSPLVSLGATLGLTRGEDESSSEFTWIDTEDHWLESRWYAQESFSDRYRANAGAVLGAMLRAPRARPRYRLGATLTAATTRRISYTFRGLSDRQGFNVIEYDDGSVRQNVVIEADGSATPVSVERYRSSYRLSLPIELALAGSWAPVPALLVAGSAHLAEWRQTAYAGQDEYGLRSNESFRRQYRNVVRYHLGAEWQVPVIALDLRAGYYTDPLPFVGPRDPDVSPGPANPRIHIAQDRRYITAGAGLLLDRVVRVDVAWTHGYFRQTEGALTERHTIDRLLAGLGYQF